MKSIVLFHTAQVNVETFDKLWRELAPEIPTRFFLDENILRDARITGITPEIQQRVTDTVMTAINEGAEVVLCTCSTIGGCAENVQSLTDKKIQRVDRAMAEKAVSLGQKIIVTAALESTFIPTRELILDVARKAGKEIEILEVLIEGAWAKFEAGDREGYETTIAEKLREVAALGDVIVLAQASMMGAEKLCNDLPIPVLSSPRLGIETAIETYRELINQSSYRENQ